jgi:F-type H+-transporting ATPase subunit b
MKTPLSFAFALLLGSLLVAGAARADDEARALDREMERATEHGAPGQGAEIAGHEGEHGAHHVPHFSDINWVYGLFGEREGVEPSIAFRPKGMPAPFGAYILNAAILYGLLYRFAKKPVAEGLKNRKAKILQGMNEAARMKADAEKSLADYEEKLATIDQEIERVRREMRAAGESERVRILAEARARRERMERDARLLVEQELAATRETLTAELVKAAMQSAATTLRERISAADQQRLADEYLTGLPKAGAALRGRV